MNLSLSILVSDVVLIGLFTANVYVKSDTFCVVVSILLHYTFLTRFCWMSVIAVQFVFAATNPFSSNKSLKSQGTFDSKAFLACLAIGWCLALIIVATCVGLNFSPLHAIGYGRNGRCWNYASVAHA